MRIGELAVSAGLPSQTIRFYEREGLLPPPSRTANGYRVYDGAALDRLGFIRAGQAAGLSLAEIRSILDLRDDGQVPCAHVTSLLAARLDELRTRQRELAELATDLEHLVTRSHHLDPADCADAAICHVLPGAGTRRR